MGKNDFVKEAPRLGPESRAHLAGRLPQSQDELTGEQREAVWAEEAARRDAEPQSEDRPAEQVFGELRKQLT